jgi:ATP-dependent helicase/DNAse subunit B
MAIDKYSSVWVSHSSISDFLKCPRLYYLKNVYKDPKTGHKINLIKPALALGQVVHNIIEELQKLPKEKRFSVPLQKKLDVHWNEITGKKGGFSNPIEESEYKERAKNMLAKLETNPGPLAGRAIRRKEDLPQYYISEEENIKLCGKIDWMEYLEDTDSVHIIDFKTGRNEEDDNSLQLPIYCLLAKNIQSKEVSKVSYWYLDKDEGPRESLLPDLVAAEENIMDVARRIKLARQINHFKCPEGGCFACRSFEKIINNEAEFVGVGGYNQDYYIIPVT